MAYPQSVDRLLYAVLHCSVSLALVASEQLVVTSLDNDLHEASVSWTDGIALRSTGPIDRDTATVAATDLSRG